MSWPEALVLGIFGLASISLMITVIIIAAKYKQGQ